MLLELRKRGSGRFHRGPRRVQDNSNGSCDRLENLLVLLTVRSRLGNYPFGHRTRIFPLRVSHGNIIVVGNRLHLSIINPPAHSEAWFCLTYD